MINLIPSEHKNRYRASSRFYKVIAIYAFSVAIIGVCLVGLYFYNTLGKSKLADKQNQLDSLVAQTKQAGSITIQAALIEDRVAAAKQYQEKEQWEVVLKTIGDMTPTNIQMTSLKVTVDSTKAATTVILGGTSPDRRSVVLYNDKLASETSFLSPTIQSLSANTDNTIFTFGIQFTYKSKVTAAAGTTADAGGFLWESPAGAAPADGQAAASGGRHSARWL